MNRRHVLKSLGATSLSGLMGSAALGIYFPKQASAVEPVTVIAIGIQIISTIMALTSKTSSGLGDQLAAINLKLDQILDNQVSILQSVQAVQSSIDLLRQDVKGLLTHNMYRDLAIDIRSHNMRIVNFINTYYQNPQEVLTNTTKKKEYDNLLLTMKDLVTRTQSTFEVTKFNTAEAGNQAIHSFLEIAPATVLIAQSLRLIYGLEGLYQNSGFLLDDYIQMSSSIELSMAYLNVRMFEDTPRAYEAIRAAEKKFETLFPESKQSIISGTEKQISGNGDPISKLSEHKGIYCYITKQTISGSKVLAIHQRLLYNLTYDYKMSYAKVPGFKNELSINIDITYDPAAEWKTDRIYTIKQGSSGSNEPIANLQSSGFCAEAPDSAGAYYAAGFSQLEDTYIIRDAFNKKIKEVVLPLNEAMQTYAQIGYLRQLTSEVGNAVEDFTKNLGAASVLVKQNIHKEWRPLSLDYDFNPDVTPTEELRMGGPR